MPMATFKLNIKELKDMLISLTQAETTRYGTLEKEKNEIMRYHNGPIEF